jgi:hypothetical protein
MDLLYNWYSVDIQLIWKQRFRRLPGDVLGPN